MAFQFRHNAILIEPSGSVEFGSGYTVTVYEAGGYAASSATGSGGSTTVTMDSGHGFDVNDYAIQSLDTTTFCRVTAVSGNSVTFAAELSVSAGDQFVNLGDSDTGTTSPNYDGSDITIYNSADSSDTVTNSRVTADSDGNYEYWHSLSGESWELVRDTTGAPVKLIPFWQGTSDSSYITRGDNIRVVNTNAALGDHTTPQAAVDWIIANGAATADNPWTIYVCNGLYQNANAKLDTAGLSYCDIVGQSWGAILMVDAVAQAGGVVILGGSSSSDASLHVSLRNLRVVNKLNGQTSSGGNPPEGAVYVGAEETYPTTVHWDFITIEGCMIEGSHDGLQVFGVDNQASTTGRLYVANNQIRSAHDSYTLKGSARIRSSSNTVWSDDSGINPYLTDVNNWKTTGFHHNVGNGDGAGDGTKVSGSYVKSVGDSFYVVGSAAKESTGVGSSIQAHTTGILIYSTSNVDSDIVPMHFHGTEINVVSSNSSATTVAGVTIEAKGGTSAKVLKVADGDFVVSSFAIDVSQTNTSGPTDVAGIWLSSNNAASSYIRAANGYIKVTNDESGSGNAHSVYADAAGAPVEDTIKVGGVYSEQASGGSGTVSALTTVS